MTQASNTRKWPQRLLLTCALAAIGAALWSYLHLYLSQAWDDWTFDRNAGKGALARKLKNGELIGRIVIPRLRTQATVREGATEKTLGLALGHIPGTALPGQKGNVGVAGHRDTLFRSLEEISEEDEILFQTMDGSYRYIVESTAVVRPSDVAVLRPGKHSQLTLVTCYPFQYVGSAPERFIVKARLVSKGPARDGAEDVIVEPPRKPASRVTEYAAVHKPRDAEPGWPVRKVEFRVKVNKSRELAEGIILALSGTDEIGRRAAGWLWVRADGRTIDLRSQAVQQPVVFQSQGRRRVLVITRVTGDSASGYLLLFDGELSDGKNETGTAKRRVGGSRPTAGSPRG